jgi:hypothetical protein
MAVAVNWTRDRARSPFASVLGEAKWTRSGIVITR